MGKTLKEYIDGAHRIVFFGGAGVSTESGIPDFRSTDGLYSQQYAWPPETIVSRGFFDDRPDEFYRFFRDKLIMEGVQPNRAHRALALLEKQGKLSAVVTQNIDGLHAAAGSRRVFELHGSLCRSICTGCGRVFDLEYIKSTQGVPHCPDCNNIIKPDIVLFDEPLDPAVTDGAIEAISRADLLIVGGTSLVVYPAAGFIRFFKGADMILINKTPTQYDRYASLVLRDPIGRVLGDAVGVD